MLKIKQRITLRVPDRLAVAAALVLTVTALGGLVSGQSHDNDGQPAPSHLLKVQQVDTTVDDTVERRGARARLLLFRRG